MAALSVWVTHMPLVPWCLTRQTTLLTILLSPSLLPGVGTEQRLAGEAAQQQATVSAAAEAAVRSAGVPLFDRLLDVFTAMLSGEERHRPV
jgi:hypothetical protein